MSSMRLRDLPRTTGFRVAVLFMALFTVLSVALFGLVYAQTSAYLSSRVDDFLYREQGPLLALTPSERSRRLEQHAAADPGGTRPFGVFDAAGRPTAGNLRELPPGVLPMDRPFAFDRPGAPGGSAFRGLAARLPDSGLLVVADQLVDHQTFKAQLLSRMLWGGLLILVLGAVGAVVIASVAVRRIDAVALAIDRIMRGDLAERLPSRGDVGDVDRLASAVNRMLAEIERLMSEVKVVSDGIAHDLRTPMTRMLSGLERVRRRDSTPADYEAAVDQAIGEIGGLLRTFNAMLRISEIDHSERRSGFTAVDLGQIALDVAEFHEPAASDKGVRLSWPDQPPVVRIEGDPSLLFEAIGNLLDNAIKFTPPGGAVTLEVRPDGVVVQDTGPGIAPEDVVAMLQPFRRGEASRNVPGNGLGLALVQAIARLHRLELSFVDARPGSRVALSFMPQAPHEGAANLISGR